MRAAVSSLLLAAAVALGACGGEPPRAEAPAAAAAGERLALAQRTVADLKPVAATVTTRDMGEARARIGGTLTEMLVREGDQVRKGQLVARVSDRRLALETRAYDAQTAAAAAEVARADGDLARVRTLYAKGIYAKARLEQAEAAAQAARGQMDASRAQGAASRELSDQGAILAPSTGRVLRADAPAGSVVAAGQSVATITSGDPLLRLEIPEGQARALRVGDRIPIVSDDLPGVGPEGVISQIYPAVNAGRVVADITAPGLDAGLVGQRVRVRVQVGQRQAFVVPRRFVSTRYGVDFVRLLGRDGGAVEVAVQIAAGPAEDQVEVLSGVGAGDVLVGPPRTLAKGPAR